MSAYTLHVMQFKNYILFDIFASEILLTEVSNQKHDVYLHKLNISFKIIF